MDSATLYSFVIQPELKGIAPMMRQPRLGAFSKRRLSFINLVPEVIFREAYDIFPLGRVVYPSKEDSLQSNQDVYCIDFIVSEKDKANLKPLFQKELNKHLPVKADIQKKLIPCYVLQPITNAQVVLKESNKTESRFSFNSLEYSGEKVGMKAFAAYLEKALLFPVFDATGLTGFYDIDFSRNNIEPLKSTQVSLSKLRLELVKEKREMDVLVITRQ